MRPENFILFLALSALFALSPTAAKCVPRNGVGRTLNHVDDKSKNYDNSMTSVATEKPKSVSPQGLFSAQLSVADHPVTGLDGALKSVCGKTRDPTFCISASMQHRTELSGDVNAKAVLLAGMDAAAESAKSARDSASKFLSQRNLPKLMNSIYETCQENYQSALDDIEEIKKALAANDYARAKSYVDSFGANFGTCADNFMDDPEPSPFTKLDDNLSKVWENMLDVYELIDPYPANNN